METSSVSREDLITCQIMSYEEDMLSLDAGEKTYWGLTASELRHKIEELEVERLNM